MTEWYCPNCHQRGMTRETRPHSRYHHCPKLGGLVAPMLVVGTKAKVTAVERQDYVGKEHGLVYRDGRPIMSVVTEREEGTDVMVFAPTARAEGSA